MHTPDQTGKTQSDIHHILCSCATMGHPMCPEGGLNHFKLCSTNTYSFRMDMSQNRVRYGKKIKHHVSFYKGAF